MIHQSQVRHVCHGTGNVEEQEARGMKESEEGVEGIGELSWG